MIHANKNIRQALILILTYLNVYHAFTAVTPTSTPSTILQASAEAMSSASKMFQNLSPNPIRSTPHTGSIPISVPKSSSIMNEIKSVSPLATAVMTGRKVERDMDDLKWTMIEDNRSRKRRLVDTIEKIDNFNGISTPLIRFRKTIESSAPYKPHFLTHFASFLMDLEQRSKWDDTVKNVEEIYPLDLVSGNALFSSPEHGILTRLGIGHCTTKPAAGGLVSPREQLTLCGMNSYDENGGIIWGFECPDFMDDLLPPDLKRNTRARSHYFSTAVRPSSSCTGFDVEYIIQLEIGGRIPAWSTTPVVIQTIKQLFKHAAVYYGPDGGVWEGNGVEERMEELRVKVLEDKEDLLVTM
mmetsp:Transcript_17194/g.35401  ORF Transcript_17194/g.35401 Transcript_17194/m.35401 type:complete len:355 (+) Transcript_17194:205-1269(+)|eukprot:CAMPEP_0118645210 /NCGR_PEP_ID=MMETSP0785-20121206/7375_1 /TAXON_ID=91992 /ORGANISM="Bolidomonas pacifica, Strain CCMP 1866" /LENGTH=354 /DNA_ID=CAMNT_0006537069 /DNA_START=208 /DNA_END=1272 /DNA_ORIENTATION=+